MAVEQSSETWIGWRLGGGGVGWCLKRVGGWGIAKQEEESGGPSALEQEGVMNSDGVVSNLRFWLGIKTEVKIP